MRVPLNRESETPLYQQIARYFRKVILDGSLEPDVRLPATRRLAQDLGVNRITVESAYAELEAEGLICSRAGSGTYILPPFPLPLAGEIISGPPWPLWQQDLRGGRPGPRAVNPDEMLAVAGHPQPISFAGGASDPRLFPIEDFRKTIQAILRADGIAAMEYGERSGYQPLRETITHVLASQGLQTLTKNILITTGSQQALSLVSQALLKAGDTVLVESPTYNGALDLFRLHRIETVGIPIDKDGMQVDRLEALLRQHRPKLIYTIPNFHNPTGTCLDSYRRRQLIALADCYNVPILEDDFVGDLRYDGRAQPTVKALDPGGRVIYVSTFSKMLMHALRIGFLVAEGPVFEALVACKRANDLATSNLFQRALHAYVTVGRYQAHLRRSCQIYRTRRDAMLMAIDKYLPPEVHIDPPQGGLFIWLRLPKRSSADELLPLACQEGVNFAPGGQFFPKGQNGVPYLRLNFATQQPEQIEEGIRRLGNAIMRMLCKDMRK